MGYFTKKACYTILVYTLEPGISLQLQADANYMALLEPGNLYWAVRFGMPELNRHPVVNLVLVPYVAPT